MQKANLEFVVDQATGSHEHHSSDDRKFAQAVADAVEVGVVVPSILRRNLADAGYKVIDDEASVSDYGFASAKVLKRVLVTDGKANIVAMGMAGDLGEALAAAALGWMREHKRPESADAPGFATVEGATALGKSAN